MRGSPGVSAIKDLQFEARVSPANLPFESSLLVQVGSGNGELKAAIWYFVKSFSCGQAHQDTCDVLLNVATEDFSHLEIVGTTNAVMSWAWSWIQERIEKFHQLVGYTNNPPFCEMIRLHRMLGHLPQGDQ